MIHVWIPGKPKTKGSLDPKNMQDTPASSRWRDMMSWALGQASYREPILARTPVAVRATFWLPVADPTIPGCGDLDKLARNLLDAGTDAPIYVDDVQVVRLFVDKMGCADGQAPGVVVSVWAPTPEVLDGWRRQARMARTLAEREQG